MLKEQFKDKREELDKYLEELEVPKIYWHRLIDLGQYIQSCNTSKPSLIARSLDIINELLAKGEKECR